MRNRYIFCWATAFLFLLVSFSFSMFCAFAADDIEPEVYKSLETQCREAGVDPDTDYMAIMEQLCQTGDVAIGERIATLRDKKIDILHRTEKKVSFNDLFLLSKIITQEAGSSWLSMDWKMSVGEVLLNRVASPEFPNTIAECIYAPGQYAGVGNGTFDGTLPYANCVTAAKRLLSGERILNDSSVVFQANFTQGEVAKVLQDDVLGNTYLCRSSHPELYK